ncbi:hypothetical protein ACWEDF_14965 [Micromonospora chersina]
MTERLIDIVATPDHRWISLWQAVAPPDLVAGHDGRRLGRWPTPP